MSNSPHASARVARSPASPHMVSSWMPRRRSWLKLSERMHVRSATRHNGPRITCAQALGCCATIGLLGSVASYSVRSRSTASSGSSSRLAKLLPKDLDGVASRTLLRALGVQLLLFGGFRPTTTGWQRRERPPASLLERVDLIAPTWKPHGLVDYSWLPGPSPTVGAAELSLFGAAAATSPLLVPGVWARQSNPKPDPKPDPNPNLSPSRCGHHSRLARACPRGSRPERRRL